MKTKEDKLIEGLIRDEFLVKAPGHFTDQVMNRIAVEPLPVRIEYKPLLGKKFWLLLAGILVLVTLFLVIGTQNAEMEVPDSVSAQVEGAWGQFSSLIEVFSQFCMQYGGIAIAISLALPILWFVDRKLFAMK